jgi:hypothetical protein
MPIKQLNHRENPWIAEGARYVYKTPDNKTHQAILKYSLVNRRTLERIDHDMTRSYEEHDGRFYDVLAKTWGRLAHFVRLIDWLTCIVVNTHGNAFDFELRSDGKLVQVEEHELGQYYGLLRHLIRGVFHEEVGLDRLNLTPYAELFRDVVTRYMKWHPFLDERFDKLPTFFDTNTRRYCGDLANELFDAIRREAKARQINQIVTAWKADGKRARDRMVKFKHECSAKHPRLYVMPLETAYRSELPEPVSLEQAKKHHAKFVNRLRGNAKFSAVAIGGVWSLSWGERKGHYFRWTFLLDAELMQDATEWAELVTSIWLDVVQDGTGFVRVPGISDHPSPIAGLIAVDDPVKMQALDEELDYIAQKGSFIQPKETAGVRSWGTWVPANTRENRLRKVASKPESDAGAQMLNAS